MGAGGSSERRASVGVVGGAGSGEGGPVFQQRDMGGARGCSIDTRNSRDFTDISNCEAGGIITPQFIVSRNKNNKIDFSSKMNGGSGGGLPTMRAPPTSSCSSPPPHGLPGYRTPSASSSELDSNKENTTPDSNGSKLAISKGITRVQPKTSTPPNRISSDAMHFSEISRSEPGLGSPHRRASGALRPVVGSATSSFESRTISEGIRRVPQRHSGSTTSSGKTSQDEDSTPSSSPTHSPNSGDLHIEEVA